MNLKSRKGKPFKRVYLYDIRKHNVSELMSSFDLLHLYEIGVKCIDVGVITRNKTGQIHLNW